MAEHGGGGAYQGVIIEESLEKKGVLQEMNIISTKVEKVTPSHKTPYLKQWTLHTVEILENDAGRIAEIISESLDSRHNDWYADFKNRSFHYIIFRHKIFFVDRKSKKQYDEAKQYGKICESQTNGKVSKRLGGPCKL